MLKELIFKILYFLTAPFIEVVPNVDDEVIDKKDMQQRAINIMNSKKEEFIYDVLWAAYCAQYGNLARNLYLECVEKHIDNPSLAVQLFVTRARETLNKTYSVKKLRLEGEINRAIQSCIH